MTVAMEAMIVMRTGRVAKAIVAYLSGSKCTEVVTVPTARLINLVVQAKHLWTVADADSACSSSCVSAAVSVRWDMARQRKTVRSCSRTQFAASAVAEDAGPGSHTHDSAQKGCGG